MREVETSPGGSSRRPRGRILALGLALVLAVAVAGVVVATRPSHGRRVLVAAPTATTEARAATAPACTLPALGAVTGPAAASLPGGAAVSPFDLDGGQLAVAVPRAGATPAITAIDAECTALASLDPSGTSLISGARSGGVAVGYGRVTVAAPLVAAAGARPPSGDAGQTGTTGPELPAPTAYDGRLAWVVVVADPLVYHCPNMPYPPATSAPATPASTVAVPASFGYSVFLLDARTGADALLYREGGPAPCGGTERVAPAVAVPSEQVSVPWTLVARSPNGYSATIRATVLSCDGHPGSASIDYDRAATSVVVQRPVHASCGAPTQVTLPLYAATVTADLPQTIEHDPVGPDVFPPPGGTASTTPGATAGVLRNLDLQQANGSTITMTVDSVVFLPDAFPTLPGTTEPAAVSSNAAVLGPLQAPTDEFRAWKPGHADLTLRTGSTTATVHVEVTTK